MQPRSRDMRACMPLHACSLVGAGPGRATHAPPAWAQDQATTPTTVLCIAAIATSRLKCTGRQQRGREDSQAARHPP